MVLSLMATTLAADLVAQTVLRQLPIGMAKYAGDIDGDAVPDVLFADGRVASGRNGGLLHRFPRAQPIGDVNADGFDDLAGDAVYSGRDGAVLHSQSSALGIDDVNGDGYDDFQVNFFLGFGWAFSGRTGATLYRANMANLHTPEPCGDVDADGCVDYVGRSGYAGLALVSGKTRLVLFSTTQSTLDYAPAGDVNGDGFADVAMVNVLSNANAVARILSGADFTELHRVVVSTIPASVPRRDGHIGPAGDLNRDGYDDFVVVAGSGGATFYSGQNGAPLGHWPRALTVSTNGFGDVDQDGFPEALVTTATGSEILQFGFSGSPPQVLTFGTPCLAAIDRMPRIEAVGQPLIGQAIVLELRAAPPNAPAALLFGAPTTQPLTAIGMPACTLYVGGIIQSASVVTDASGEASIPLPLPSTASALGLVLAQQWAVAAPAAPHGIPAALSDAVVTVLGR